MEQLPIAKARGWPMTIDFDSLPNRVEVLRSTLEGIMNNKDSSVFWRQLKEDINKDGLMKTVGLSGQLSAFSSYQPG